MDFIFYVLLMVFVFGCAALIFMILSQEGKGGGISGMGATMGDTIGYGGAASTLRQWTRWLTTVFMAGACLLTFLGEYKSNQYDITAAVATPKARPGAPRTASAPEAPAATTANPGVTVNSAPATGGAAAPAPVAPVPAAGAVGAKQPAPAAPATK